MALSADILRGYTDTIILKRLSLGDSYGYELGKQIGCISQGGLEMKEATLYTAFRRLEGSGLIRSYWGDAQSGARRRYYAVTPEGLERLSRDVENWQETKQLLAKLIEEEPE
ncbi:MAG: helix-turn-helix transcriptional regulator [Clostridia bacterium]|nr:helix-turn-helix transcriptional regulator [Clostridia bacterium]